MGEFRSVLLVLLVCLISMQQTGCADDGGGDPPDGSTDGDTDTDTDTDIDSDTDTDTVVVIP